MYTRVPREKMAPMNNGITETVQYQVSQSAGPKNAVPVLHSVPVHSVGTGVAAVARWFQHHFIRVSALQRMWCHDRGYCGDRTARGGPDAACRGASCGSRRFRGF